MKELIPIYSALLVAGPVAAAFVYKELTKLNIDQHNETPGRNALLTCLVSTFAFSVGVLGLLLDAALPNPLLANTVPLIVTLVASLTFFYAFFCSAVDRTKPKPG